MHDCCAAALDSVQSGFVLISDLISSPFVVPYLSVYLPLCTETCMSRQIVVLPSLDDSVMTLIADWHHLQLGFSSLQVVSCKKNDRKGDRRRKSCELEVKITKANGGDKV